MGYIRFHEWNDLTRVALRGEELAGVIAFGFLLLVVADLLLGH